MVYPYYLYDSSLSSLSLCSKTAKHYFRNREDKIWRLITLKENKYKGDVVCVTGSSRGIIRLLELTFA